MSKEEIKDDIVNEEEVIEEEIIDEDNDLEDDSDNESHDDDDEVITDRYQESKKKEKEDKVPVKTVVKWKQKYRDMKSKYEEALSKGGNSTEEAKKLAEKHGFDEDFVEDLLGAAEAKATKKLQAQFEAAEKERQMEKIEKAFDNEFQKMLKLYPDMEGKRTAIKNLAFSKPYSKKTLNEIVEEVFISDGSDSSETDTKPKSSELPEKIDFANMSDDIRNKVMKDPDARRKYYDYLDKNGA
jgi:hypothetical protein